MGFCLGAYLRDLRGIMRSCKVIATTELVSPQLQDCLNTQISAILADDKGSEAGTLRCIICCDRIAAVKS